MLPSKEESKEIGSSDILRAETFPVCVIENLILSIYYELKPTSLSAFNICTRLSGRPNCAKVTALHYTKSSFNIQYPGQLLKTYSELK